jgi:hypothetical protein
VNQLVTEHLGDKRWREVFLLLAGLRNADDLLLAIEQKSRTYMTTPKRQRLLVWVDEVSDPNSGDFQPVGKRAIAYAIAIAIAIAYANADVIAYADVIAIAYVIAYANAYAYADADVIDYAYANALAIANADTIKFFIQYARWAMEFEIYQKLDLQSTIGQLEQLQDQIPNEQQPKEQRQAFRKQLTSIFLAAFNLTPKMVDLSMEEIKAMDNYLYATRLLIECDRAAVRRTSEVWRQIEERMLRPVALTPSPSSNFGRGE